MLSTNQLDFLNYKNALKGNYRKGVHAFRTILANPTQAADFAANLGGVSLVLGWPIGQDDRNSQELLDLLLESEVLDRATLTWMSQWYPDYATDWDTLASDPVRAAKMMGDAQIWRAVGHSPVAAGKVIATLAGLSCAEYADINAVAASSTAMAAVATSETVMAAVVASEMAMESVIASPTAMAAVWQTITAIQAVKADPTAWQILIRVDSAVMGKAAAMIVGLNPDDYVDMDAIAASQTAMAAVAASQTAREAIETSSTAIGALDRSPLAVDVRGSAAQYGSTTLYNGYAWAISGGSLDGGGITYYTIDDPTTPVSFAGSLTISKFVSQIKLDSLGYTVKSGSANIIKC